LSRAPEIFPDLIARKTVVLFNPVAAAAAARLYGIMLPVVTLVVACSIVIDWLMDH
jgi:hypothetical protein